MDIYKMNVVDRPIEFLGCYAIDISISAGFKSNNSTCSVVLIEDEHPYANDTTDPNYAEYGNPTSSLYKTPKKFIDNNNPKGEKYGICQRCKVY
jgi:hypothetical protein